MGERVLEPPIGLRRAPLLRGGGTRDRARTMPPPDEPPCDPLAAAVARDWTALAAHAAAPLFAHRLAAAAVAGDLPEAGLAVLRAAPGGAAAVEAAALFAGGASLDWAPSAAAPGDADAVADAAAATFEADSDPRARAGAALAALRAAAAAAAPPVYGLLAPGAESEELIAIVCAALASGVAGAPPVADAARGARRAPCVLAALALNVDGALAPVCRQLATDTTSDDLSIAAAAAGALAAVAGGGAAARGAVLAAAAAAGAAPGPVLSLMAADPDAALAAPAAAARGGGLPWLAAALGADSDGARAASAALAAAVALLPSAPWTHADDAHLRAHALLLAAGAPPARAAAGAWAARFARAPRAALPPASRLAATAALLMSGDAVADDVLAGAVRRVLELEEAGGEDPFSLPCPTTAWLASLLLHKRWGWLADGLRRELGTGVRFPDAALATLAAAAGGGARAAAARAAAAAPPSPGLAAGHPASAARAAQAVAAALQGGDPGARPALVRSAGAHARAAGAPLHPALVALVDALAAAGARLRPDDVAACTTPASVDAAVAGRSGAAVLASLAELTAASAPCWPPPGESLPLARLAAAVAAPGAGFGDVRGRWLAAAGEAAPGCVPASGGRGEVRARRSGVPLAAPPSTPAAALHFLRTSPPPTDVGGALAALDAALPHLLAPRAPRSAGDALASWLDALPPPVARVARARVAWELGCALDGDGRASRKRKADGSGGGAVASASADADALLAAPLLALAPSTYTWTSPVAARVCVHVALASLADARRAARALAPRLAPALIPADGEPPSVEAAMAAQDGAAALLLIEALARAKGAAATAPADAAAVGAALAAGLHALLLDAPAAARLAASSGFDARLAPSLVGGVPALHIATDFAGPATGHPASGALACALAGSLAASYPTPTSLAGAHAALARAGAAADAGDAGAVAAALPGAAAAAAGLPSLAAPVGTLAAAVAGAVAACCAQGEGVGALAAAAEGALQALARARAPGGRES